jgi:hypothetical protein
VLIIQETTSERIRADDSVSSERREEPIDEADERLLSGEILDGES